MANDGIDLDEPGFLRLLDTVTNALSATCKLITGVSLVALTTMFGWLVWGRYVMNETPTWVEQVALLLVMVIAFLGAAVGVHENTHLSVAAFRTAVPAKLRLVFVVASDILMLVFGALMLWYGGTLTLFKWGSDIPLIHVPEGLRSLPLTIGGGLILLFTFRHLLRLFLGRDTRTDSIQ